MEKLGKEGATLDRTGILLLIMLIATTLVVILSALLTLAGQVQWYVTSLMMMPAQSTAIGTITIQQGIQYSMILATILTSGLGAPLSWGASLLKTIDPNFWLTGYLSQYLLYKALIQIGLLYVPP